MPTATEIVAEAARLGIPEATVRANLAPAVRLTLTSAAQFSRVGGDPDLPDGTPWPTWDPTAYDTEQLAYYDKQASDFMREQAAALRAAVPRGLQPLSFLAQIDLSELGELAGLVPLPRAGRLWFFYSVVDQPWGYSPTHAGAFPVLFAEGATPVTRRAAPSGVEVLNGSAVAFSACSSIRPWIEGADEATGDLWWDLQEAIGDEPDHQMGGHPTQLQGDMQRSCALVTRGIQLGSPPDLPKAELDRLAADAHEWRLLLQLGSDSALQWMWGDAGGLYFWIRAADIEAGRWDRSWFQLQCG